MVKEVHNLNYSKIPTRIILNMITNIQNDIDNKFQPQLINHQKQILIDLNKILEDRK